MNNTNTILKEILNHYADDSSPNNSPIITGFKRLDSQFFEGAKTSPLILVGSRPCMGKTSFVLNIAANLAVGNKTPVLILSGEQTKKEILERILLLVSQIRPDCARNKSFTEHQLDQLAKAVTQLSTAPIYIYDTVSENIIAQAQSILPENSSMVVIIDDYSWFRTSKKQYDLFQMCKEMTQSLGWTVFLTAPLNRNLEIRYDKRPRLSDLRAKIDIENLIDVGLFLHRPEVYDPYSPSNGLVELWVRKNKLGNTGFFEMAMNSAIGKFHESYRQPESSKIDWGKLLRKRKTVFPPQWIQDYSSTNLTIRYLQNACDLEIEGRIQGNCIAGYRNEIMNGEQQIYHSLINNKDHIFSLKKENGGMFINEFKARFNQAPTPEARLALASFLEKHSVNIGQLSSSAH